VAPPKTCPGGNRARNTHITRPCLSYHSFPTVDLTEDDFKGGGSAGGKAVDASVRNLTLKRKLSLACIAYRGIKPQRVQEAAGDMAVPTPAPAPQQRQSGLTTERLADGVVVRRSDKSLRVLGRSSVVLLVVLYFGIAFWMNLVSAIRRVVTLGSSSCSRLSHPVIYWRACCAPLIHHLARTARWLRA
jgi:hypothetical protein